MPQLRTVRCLDDNYAYLIHEAGQTVLVDAPEAGPILNELNDAGWSLDVILLTHHHDDHIQAVPAIVEATGAQVWGNGADARRLPPLDRALSVGEVVDLLDDRVDVLDAPGHTIGHVAFNFERSKMLFTADSLMALGCGRLFEGDADTMWNTLDRLAALPGDTLVCSGHDYCRSNGAFALSVDPDNQALRQRLSDNAAGKRPCSPATLSDEIATNPFLRAAALADSLGMTDQPANKVFAQLRKMKDSFRG
ncbi:MAG: hydroxyacylglutathione hydrolase [Paracoccus denitrificans]|nr:MAG: hydroxyacylglutathione hydrolase [Paracoccus denitrificans]PZO84608.1 MAG: hydroxyacylglutathione hydrolase [Paracoccus denitrificans]